MKKLSLICLALVGILLFSACSPSPTAVVVGSRKVDASEYAFYLNYNRLTGPDTEDKATYSAAETARARQAALEQILASEVILIKCKELGLKLSEEQRTQLADSKQALIEELGGKAAYLEYLTAYGLTDRCYDKFQQNGYYYTLLYEYVTQQMNPELYTEEALRRYFGENYILVKYVYVSLLDDEGRRMDSQASQGQRQLANEVHAMISRGATFDEVSELYLEDQSVSVSIEGVAVSRLEAGGQEWLTHAFQLKSGEVSPVLGLSDGFYVIKRLELSAGYFERNQEYITQSAQDYYFGQALDGWKADTTLKTKKIVDKIDLNNFREYVK